MQSPMSAERGDLASRWGQVPGDIATLIAALDIDADDQHAAQAIDWSTVRRSAFLVHQHVRYSYPGPIRDLRQRLVLIPPATHGGQRLVTHRLDVSVPQHSLQTSRDGFGNVLIEIDVPEVEEAIEFTAWIVVERDALAGPPVVPALVAADPRLRAPTPLTTPDDAVRTIAAELRAQHNDPWELADAINRWVFGALTYAYGVTDVTTPAATALAGGRGVCQDYAQIMLTICRAAGLAARYVSGHLLGDGGTHAWVEVLLPDQHGSGQFVAQPFDPTHGRVAGMNYITVATGRDYRDVAPTSGAFIAPYGGQLSTRKRARVATLESFATASGE